MNILFKAGSILALFVTIVKIVVGKIWSAAPSALHFVAENAPFFYAFSLGIIVAGLTRRFWVIILAIAAVFITLKWIGW